MYICRLFHKDQPFEQIDARIIAEGQITIGRDPDADWILTDADGTLSRLHCTLAVTEKVVVVVAAWAIEPASAAATAALVISLRIEGLLCGTFRRWRHSSCRRAGDRDLGRSSKRGR